MILFQIFYDTIMTEKGAQFYSEMTKYKDMSEIEDLSNKLTNLIISRQTTNEKILNECQNIVKVCKLVLIIYFKSI